MHLNKRSFSGHIGFWCHQKTAEIAEIVEIPPHISCLRLYTQSRPRTLTKEFLHSISHPALSKNGVNSVKSVKTPGRFVTSCPLCPRSRVLGIARELATGQSLFTITERSLRCARDDGITMRSRRSAYDDGIMMRSRRCARDDERARKPSSTAYSTRLFEAGIFDSPHLP